MGKQNKTPLKKLETIKTVVDILAGIAAIVKIVLDILKG